MSKHGSVHGTLVDEIHILACQIVQSVQIFRLFLHNDSLIVLLYCQYRLKHNSGTILNKLAQRMKIGGQIYGCRHQTLMVFSFGLTIKLFPPLGYRVKARLIVCQNLCCFSFSEKDITDSCIFYSVILLIGSIQCALASACCTFH